MKASTVELAVPYAPFPRQPPLEEANHYYFQDLARPQGFSLAVRRDYFDAGDDTNRHWHEDFYALYIVLAGHGVALINDRPYGIAPGDVYIMPPAAAHGYRNYQRIMVNAFYFQMQLFTRTELASLRRFKNFWKLMKPDGARAKGAWADRRLHLSPELNREVQVAVDNIQTDICEPSPLGPLLAHHQFFCLLVKLARWHEKWTQDTPISLLRSSSEYSYGTDPGKSGDDYAAGLGDTVRFCEENSHLPLTVTQLAKRLHLSTRHFSHLFTTQMKVPPGTFLRRLRMERAQLLLRTTALSITEIANAVGIADPDSLSHAFRAAFGVTPLQYRKLSRK